MKIRISKNHMLWIFIGFLALTLLGLLTKQIVAAQSSANQPLPDPYIQDIQALEKVPKENLSAQDRKSLEDKLSMLYAQSTQRAIGIQQLTDLPQGIETRPIPTLILSEKRMTGIIEHPSVPFSTMDYLIENAWQELVNNQYVLIYAGVLSYDHQQGVLLISTESPRRTQQVLIPGKTGAVRISEAKNLQLILDSQSGKQLFFDVLGRTFVDKLGVIVPTITPMSEILPTSTQPVEIGTAYP